MQIVIYRRHYKDMRECFVTLYSGVGGILTQLRCRISVTGYDMYARDIEILFRCGDVRGLRPDCYNVDTDEAENFLCQSTLKCNGKLVMSLEYLVDVIRGHLMAQNIHRDIPVISIDVASLYPKEMVVCIPRGGGNTRAKAYADLAKSILTTPAKPTITKVIFNDPATIVFWSDNTKTIVKAHDEPFDPEKGLAMAISKKMLGNTGRYFEEFKKWLPEKPKDDEVPKCLECRHFTSYMYCNICRGQNPGCASYFESKCDNVKCTHYSKGVNAYHDECLNCVCFVKGEKE